MFGGYVQRCMFDRLRAGWVDMWEGWEKGMARYLETGHDGNGGLDLPTSYFLPSYSTGGKGLPVAIKALPLVHSLMSFGSASWSRVGLLKGKIIGRSTCLAISLTTSSVKALGLVEVPISTCGLTSLTTERRS